MNVDEDTLRRIMREELGSLESRFNTFESSFDEKLNLKLAEFYGQWNRYLDDRFSEFEERVDVRLENMEAAITALVDRVSTDEIERAAAEAQLNRHDSWIHQLANKANVRLAA